MEIKNTYLMWIGKEHYSKISDWTDEALAQGISKRLPNEHVAAAMMEEGTVIFVAHDEGEYRECEACHGTIENPERRKLEQEVLRLRKEIQKLSDDAAVVASSHGLSEREMEALAARGEHPTLDPEKQAELDRLDKLADNRRAKVKKLNAQIDGLEKWVKAGTGGSVTVTGPGMKTETWDYRRYNYWLHQPKRFNADDVISTDMCECCGGTGRLPEGKVFGMFIPGDFEYIVPEGAEVDIVAKMKEMGLTTVDESVVLTEAKRGCGKRKAGGVYVVTRTEGVDPTKTKEAVAALVAEGKLDPAGVEVTGQFARFLIPVAIDAKRFRGIKRWGLDPAVEDEAEMIAEAV